MVTINDKNDSNANTSLWGSIKFDRPRAIFRCSIQKHGSGIV